MGDQESEIFNLCILDYNEGSIKAADSSNHAAQDNSISDKINKRSKS